MVNFIERLWLIYYKTKWATDSSQLPSQNWHILQAAGSANGDLDTEAADETTAILNAINSRLYEDVQNLKCIILFESGYFLEINT